MSYSKHKLILQAYRVSDLLAFILAGLVAAWVAGISNHHSGFWEILSIRFSLVNLLGYLVLALLWLVVFDRIKLYAAMKPKQTLLEEVVVIGWATGIATAVYGMASVFFDISLFTPVFLLTFWVFSAALTWVFRRGLRLLLKKVHLGDNNECRIMVIGTNEAARNYVELIKSNRDMGFNFVGYISNDQPDEVPVDEYLGPKSEFKRIFDNTVVDEVVITLPIHHFTKEVEELIDYASAHGILVRLPMSQLFGSMFGNHVWRLRTEMVSRMGESSSSDLVLGSGHDMGWEYLAKRAFDFCSASVLLILTSPLMIGAALAIKFTSKGDVMFVQDRYGYNGRVFKLYKFRTMIQNADELQEALRKQNEREGAAFKIKDDPRITSVGKFLRKSSIDELPQLLNVIKGEMSLVGPRPLPLADYERFQEVSHMRRLSVLPGITCTWQASGRDNVTFDEWMELDMAYIDNWSLVSDFAILLKTVPAVLFGRGAS
ncbi:MAG: sugar transferase [Oceanospirillaceae bacterium]|nr:sugar transferase [Oceanospirillaceae bacterium]